MPDTPPPTILDLTPMNPQYRADPHVVLDDIRARCPVFHDTVSSSIILTRYADVRAVINDATMLRDPLLTTSGAAMMQRRHQGRMDAGVPRTHLTSILTLDDPDHRRIRQPLAMALYARVARCRPMIEALVEATLDRLAGATAIDLMAEFCVPIPVEAIASILGVDQSRLTEFRHWSEGVIQGLNPFRNAEQSQTMEAASAAVGAYFNALMADRRIAPRDDLITDMVQLQASGTDLSDAEILLNLIALLVGGNLTTTDLIGNGVRQLLLHPAELAKLQADPGLINAVIEEILRYEPPIDITGRVTPGDTIIAGCPVGTHQSITVSLRSANRDPAMFEDPHRFNVTRTHRPHVAFGGGSHICIGAPLARLEANIAIAKLFARFPNLALATANDPPAWRSMPFFRGMETLLVTL